MTTINLLAVLDSIPISADSAPNGFRVERIPSLARHYAGRDGRGFPCLLLESSNAGVHPPIELDGISIQYSLPCSVSQGADTERLETLTVIIGKTADPQLQRYFIHVCEAIVGAVGNTPSFAEITQAIQKLVDLFRRIAQPSTESLAGIIGELTIIRRARNAVAAANAWRSGTDDRFDFSQADARLEVKATSTRRRIHNLSLEQCVPPIATRGVLASVFIETIGGGLSLLELIQSIEARLYGNSNSILKLHSVIAETLGSALPASLEIRFDAALAQESIKFYDLRSIPAIRTDVPPGVSSVYFRSDISRTRPLTGKDLEQLPPTLMELLPA